MSHLQLLHLLNFDAIPVAGTVIQILLNEYYILILAVPKYQTSGVVGINRNSLMISNSILDKALNLFL